MKSKKYKITLIDDKGWSKTMTITGKPPFKYQLMKIGREYEFELVEVKPKFIYRQTKMIIY